MNTRCPGHIQEMRAQDKLRGHGPQKAVSDTQAACSNWQPNHGIAYVRHWTLARIADGYLFKARLNLGCSDTCVFPEKTRNNTNQQFGRAHTSWVPAVQDVAEAIVRVTRSHSDLVL